MPGGVGGNAREGLLSRFPGNVDTAHLPGKLKVFLCFRVPAPPVIRSSKQVMSLRVAVVRLDCLFEVSHRQVDSALSEQDLTQQ